MLTFPKNRLLQGSLPVRLGLLKEEKWPIYQASGYGEVFMYDQNERLRWFPNYETLVGYGYTGAERKTVPISWFYDKPIVGSITDTKTGKIYPAEATPNYEAYIKVVAPPPEPEIKCPTCGATFSSLDALVRHIAEEHKPPTPPVYKCPICGATFASLDEVRRHTEERHAPAPPPPTVYKCPKCGATFSSLIEMTRHLAEEHKPYVPPTPPLPPTEIQKIQVTCPQCRSRLEVTLSPIPSGITLLASMPALCPICGAEVYRDFTKMLRVSAILERKPWPPVTYLPPAPPPLEPRPGIGPLPLQVTPPAGWPEAWPEVGIIPPDKFPTVAPVTDYQGVVGFPIEEKLEYWLEEPALAVAETPAPWYKRYLPHLIMGGLGVTAVTVAIAKVKKKAKR